MAVHADTLGAPGRGSGSVSAPRREYIRACHSGRHRHREAPPPHVNPKRRTACRGCRPHRADAPRRRSTWRPAHPHGRGPATGEECWTMACHPYARFGELTPTTTNFRVSFNLNRPGDGCGPILMLWGNRPLGRKVAASHAYQARQRPSTRHNLTAGHRRRGAGPPGSARP
jgi:hypothetical protein